MSAPDSSLEIERKYAVGAGFVLPDLSMVPGVAAVTGPDTYHLTAVYLDTPGLDLAAARITLRRRTGGTDAGWHLKLPAGAEARREVHAPLGPGGEPVPGRAVRPGGRMYPRPAAAPDRPAADHPHGAPAHRCRRSGAG